MNSYENLPRLQGAQPARVVRFSFKIMTGGATPYNLLYTVDQDGQLYVSLEHLTAMLHGSKLGSDFRLRLQSSPQSKGINYLGAPRAVFEWCQQQALKLGAKVIEDERYPTVLGLPIGALSDYLQEVQAHFTHEAEAYSGLKLPRHLTAGIRRLDWFYTKRNYQQLAAELTRDSLKHKSAPTTAPSDREHRPRVSWYAPRYPYYTWL